MNKEFGTIRGVFFGADDAGDSTIWLNIAGIDQSWVRKFGGLSLTKELVEDLAKELMNLYDVSDIKDLVNKKCKVLLSNTVWGTLIEGIENSNGVKFTISDWRKKHHWE